MADLNPPHDLPGATTFWSKDCAPIFGDEAVKLVGESCASGDFRPSADVGSMGFQMDSPDKLDDAEADRRRDEALKRMLKTPPQPRKKGREPKPAPKS
mgnify:CR=1 FL=1